MLLGVNIELNSVAGTRVCKDLELINPFDQLIMQILTNYRSACGIYHPFINKPLTVWLEKLQRHVVDVLK